jgi:hypothetical protein
MNRPKSLFVFYAEGVTYVSPGQVILATARITQPWVGVHIDRSAEESAHHPFASMPRPKQSAACCSLGNVAIGWKSQLSTAHIAVLPTQGGAARLASLGSALG